MGGKAKNLHKDVRARKIRGRGASRKAMVVGAMERGGQVRLAGLTPDRETLGAFIDAKLAHDTTAIMGRTIFRPTMEKQTRIPVTRWSIIARWNAFAETFTQTRWKACGRFSSSL